MHGQHSGNDKEASKQHQHSPTRAVPSSPAQGERRGSCKLSGGITPAHLCQPKGSAPNETTD